MRNLLTAAVAIFAFASVNVARAADMAGKAPPPDPAPTCAWCGWYGGPNAGWIGSVSSHLSNTGTDTGAGGLGTILALGSIPSSVSLSNSGFVGGGQLGYNWQTANWVYGLEADFDGASAKKGSSASGAPLFPNLSTSFSREIDWLSTVRGRIGVTASPSLLIFATGGLAFGQTQIGNAFICPTCGPPSTSEPSTANQSTKISAGWTVGAGTEWMFARSWSLKVEYLYADLGNHSSTIVYTYAPNTSSIMSTVHDAENIVRGGINYHF